MTAIVRRKKSKLERLKEKTEKIKAKGAEIRLAIEPIMKVVSNEQHITNLLLNAGIAYYGYRTNNHWTGAIAGLLGLRLAQQESLISSGTGVGILGTLGVVNMAQYVQQQTGPTEPVPPPIWEAFLPPLFHLLKPYFTAPS